MSDKKVLTIDRNKWRRGYLGEGLTKLLNTEGYMCCLGFDALACGFTRDQILDVEEPEQLINNVGIAVPHNYQTTRGNTSTIVGSAILYNDKPPDTFFNEADREREVKEALIDLGWDDVVFVN